MVQKRRKNPSLEEWYVFYEVPSGRYETQEYNIQSFDWGFQIFNDYQEALKFKKRKIVSFIVYKKDLIKLKTSINQAFLGLPKKEIPMW